MSGRCFRMDCRINSGNDERKHSRDAAASEVCRYDAHEKPKVILVTAAGGGIRRSFDQARL